MKVQKVQPVISDIAVVIDDLKYKGDTCSIRVECHISTLEDARNNVFTPLYATCGEPYFVMGTGFWEENFGKRQSNRIKKLCTEAVAKYLKENS